MDKIWFIAIDGKPEGPYSLMDLRRDDRITLKTLVWREGFDQWIPLKDAAELKKIFADAEKPDDDQEMNLKKIDSDDEELALNAQHEFPPFLWVILVLIILSYLFYHFLGFHE